MEEEKLEKGGEEEEEEQEEQKTEGATLEEAEFTKLRKREAVLHKVRKRAWKNKKKRNRGVLLKYVAAGGKDPEQGKGKKG